jgi:multidrug efflux pump subunit AcrB
VFDEVIEPRLVRIPGVSRVNMNSLRPLEERIKFDSYQAAALGVPITSISQSIASATDVSAGFADVGRRQ